MILPLPDTQATRPSTTDFEKLSVFRLQAGAHKSAERGLCFMEAAAWLEGEKHSDSPKCVCPVIAVYSRRLNDRLPDDWRQRLVAYLPRVVGTRSKEHELPRAQYLVRRSVTVTLPLLADAIRVAGVAATLRALPADASMTDLHEASLWARPLLRNAAAAADAAAAYAAYAADGADAAAYAAAADAAADYACVADAQARVPLYEAGIATLDGLLAIGPSGRPFARPIDTSIAAYRELVQV